MSSIFIVFSLWNSSFSQLVFKRNCTSPLYSWETFPLNFDILFFLIMFVWNVEQYFTSFVKVFIWFHWFSVIRQLWNWLVTQIFVSKVGSPICWKISLNCSSSYQRCPLLFFTLWSQFDLLHTLKIALKKHSVIELSFLLPTRFMNFLICLTFYNW